jgi:3-hydroxyisobutyrate dehydrogenase-like beta-hydroxyacid dehydrogenase
MVDHLMAAGHILRVYARRPEVMQLYVARGAVPCASPAEAARTATVVFLNVTATADVAHVLFGVHGVQDGAASGTVVIDHSTIAADATRQFAQRLAARGITLLDCPVSGGVAGAHAATLSLMVGGPAEVLARVRPLLRLLGSTITHCGAVGAGQVVKACNQIVQVVTIQGLAEAMLLARAQSVELGPMLAALTAGMAGSRMLDLMGPKMAARDFTAGIEARLHHKDYGLIVDMARDAHVALPAVALIAQQLHALMSHGWGAWDTSALLPVLEAANGRGDEPGEHL